MDKHEKKALEDIEKYGCHILHVMAEDELPKFSYSIGIQKKTNAPEIIVIGLNSDLSHWIINSYNQRIIEGEKFEENKLYSDFLEGFDVVFQKIDKKFYRKYLGWALWLYNGDSFDALQMLYPTTSGIYPWDEDAPEEFKKITPFLFEWGK